MKIIIDIDDATGAVTITPETQDPEASAAEEQRMAAIRSFICAPAPRSPLSPDTDLPAADYSVMAFMAGVPWWSMSEPGEPEPALYTITFDTRKRAASRDGIKRALDSANMPERLSGCRVVVDWTGAEAVTASAVHETILWLYNRNAAAVVFVTDNQDVADAIGRVLGWEDVTTLLPITLVDNSVKEPEAPEPALDTGSDPDPRDMRMPYCRWSSDHEPGRHATEYGYGVTVLGPGVYEWVDPGVYQCRWYRHATTLSIQWADGVLDRCYRVHPDATQLRVHQVSEGGKWSAWWPTTDGSKRAMFDTEEQARTFVARLAEAFEKGKA